MSNSAVNPFVYFFCHDKFKKEFQNRFKWCFPGGGGGGGAAGGTVGAGGHRGGGGGGRRGGGGKRRWVAKLRYFVSPCFVLLPFLKKGFFCSDSFFSSFWSIGVRVSFFYTPSIWGIITLFSCFLTLNYPRRTEKLRSTEHKISPKFSARPCCCARFWLIFLDYGMRKRETESFFFFGTPPIGSKLFSPTPPFEKGEGES